jgi:hypothetical protein
MKYGGPNFSSRIHGLCSAGVSPAFLQFVQRRKIAGETPELHNPYHLKLDTLRLGT